MSLLNALWLGFFTDRRSEIEIERMRQSRDQALLK